MPLNPKVMAEIAKKQQLPLAKEQSCGCGGCTCGADEKTEKQFDIDKTYEILTEL